jgi:hypothetical protein
MNGKQLQGTLETIEAGELYSIFNLLPQVAGGANWVGEIEDCARSMSEWLDPEKEYDLDDLRDLGGQWANSECEDYYSNINKRVQDLSLWASPELDDEVNELGVQHEEISLTKLHSLYLYAAMRQLWDAVADQAFQNTEELANA